MGGFFFFFLFFDYFANVFFSFFSLVKNLIIISLIIFHLPHLGVLEATLPRALRRVLAVTIWMTHQQSENENGTGTARCVIGNGRGIETGRGNVIANCNITTTIRDLLHLHHHLHPLLFCHLVNVNAGLTPETVRMISFATETNTIVKKTASANGIWTHHGLLRLLRDWVRLGRRRPRSRGERR